VIFFYNGIVIPSPFFIKKITVGRIMSCSTENTTAAQLLIDELEPAAAASH
jgi:hypothetical protein